MQTRVSLSIICLIIQQFYAFSSGTGRVTGMVVDTKGDSLVGIAVVVQGNDQGSITDLHGEFNIDGLPYGQYQLIFKGLGYAKKTVYFELNADGPHKHLKIVLQVQDQFLQEVLVTGRKEISYINNYSFIGTKTASRVMDIPQTISSITKELIEDQQAWLITDVVGNLAGVNQYSAYDDLTIRGFRNGWESGFRLVNGLRSGYGYGTSFFRVPLTNNLESIEVLKGPGAALFGDISPGGTVNLVTKKPLEEERKAVGFTVGSFHTMRTSLDLTGPLNNDKNLLYRLNIGYEDTRTFRDVNYRKSLMVAPTVTFNPTEKTKVNVELVYSSFDGYLDRGMSIRGGDLYALPRSFTLSQPSDYFRVSDVSANASLNHKITNELSFNAAYMKFVYHEDLAEHRTLNTFADAPENTIMNLRYMEKKIHEFTDNLSAYLSLSGNTGYVEHDVVFGVDHIRYETDKNGHQWEARQVEIDGEPVPLTFDLNKPTYELRDPSSYIRLPIAPFFIDYLNASYSTTGIFLQDQLKGSERLRLLLGVRYELFRDTRKFEEDTERIRQNVFLPRLGLTYTLRENINYFASYSQGYKPVNPEFVRNPENYGSDTPFKSETSFQAETGLKGEFFQKGLFTTLSVYHIERRNMLINTGMVTEEGNPVYRQNGRIKSQGAELELTGNLKPNLSLNINYAFNHTEMVEAELKAEREMMAPNAPKHSAGWWIKYAFIEMDGFGFALGGSYVTRRRMENLIDDPLTGEKVWQYWPSYTVANLALFYNVNKFKLGLNIDNVYNAYYFIGGYDYARAFPGPPRRILVSFGYTF